MAEEEEGKEKDVEGGMWRGGRARSFSSASSNEGIVIGMSIGGRVVLVFVVFVLVVVVREVEGPASGEAIV